MNSRPDVWGTPAAPKPTPLGVAGPHNLYSAPGSPGQGVAGGALVAGGTPSVPFGSGLTGFEMGTPQPAGFPGAPQPTSGWISNPTPGERMGALKPGDVGYVPPTASSQASALGQTSGLGLTPVGPVAGAIIYDTEGYPIDPLTGRRIPGGVPRRG